MIDKQRIRVENLFETAFKNTQELDQYFRLEYETEYSEIATEALSNEGFPMNHITYQKVNLFIELISKISLNKWAELFEEDLGLTHESVEYVESLLDSEHVKSCILDNLKQVECEVTIEDDLIDILDIYPTKSYFINRVQKYFDMERLEDILGQMTYYQFPEYIQSQIDGIISDELGVWVKPQYIEMIVYPKFNELTDDQLELLYLYRFNQGDSLTDYINSNQIVEDIISLGDFEIDLSSPQIE